ncbi:MAG: hypothetical protein WAV79_15970, partial [Anaerolineae bacterium]
MFSSSITHRPARRRSATLRQIAVGLLALLVSSIMTGCAAPAPAAPAATATTAAAAPAAPAATATT